MRKEKLLKIIVENPDLKKEFWPEFKTDDKIEDYSSLITLKSQNSFLKTLRNLIMEDKLTENQIYKQVLKVFNL